MYLGLFKIRILNRQGRGYQMKPPVVIVRGQHGAPFLHFITLKQMNQKIKAPGQHIKADQLRLEGLNGKKPLELRGTRWRILMLMLYWRGSPQGDPHEGEPTLKSRLLPAAGSQSGPSLPPNTEEKHAPVQGWNEDVLLAAESRSVCLSCSTICEIGEWTAKPGSNGRRVGREALWVKTKGN